MFLIMSVLGSCSVFKTTAVTGSKILDTGVGYTDVSCYFIEVLEDCIRLTLPVPTDLLFISENIKLYTYFLLLTLSGHSVPS